MPLMSDLSITDRRKKLREIEKSLLRKSSSNISLQGKTNQIKNKYKIAYILWMKF